MQFEKRRVKLGRGKQKEIIKIASERYGSLRKLALKLNIPRGTLGNYYREERFMPETIFDEILKIDELNKNSLKVSYLDYYWGNVIGGKNGMSRLEKKYPDKIGLWRKVPKKSAMNRLKKINLPKIDEKLAEFAGVYLGDGTLTPYFIRIAGDWRYDLPYFNYLKSLVNDIFGIEAKITKNKTFNTAYFTVYSKEVCSFFRNKLNFGYGDKLRNNTLIPNIILEDNNLALACLRGLIDTDGSVSRRGNQFTVTFISHNPNLTLQVKKISDLNKLFSFISSDGRTIGTNDFERVTSYFKIVGSSNLRHIVGFNERYIHKKSIYRNQVINYYQKELYTDLKLPFKLTQ